MAHTRSTRRLLCCLAALVVACSLAGAAGATSVATSPADLAGASPVGSQTATADANESGPAVVEVEYRRSPDRDQHVRATITLHPEDGGEWTVSDRDSWVLVEQHGFRETGDGADTVYEWDGETAEPTLTVDDPYDALIADAWTENESWVVFAPNHGGGVTSYDTDHVVEETFADEHTTFGNYVGLGAFEEVERTVDGTRHRVVHPAAVEPIVPAETHLDAAAESSALVPDGDAPEERTTLLAPRSPFDRGSAGGHTMAGGAVFVRASSNPISVSDPDTTIHEHVHTQQSFSTGERMRWYTEGSARYLQTILGVRLGYRDRAEFDRMLWNTRSHDDAVLANRSTWGPRTDYEKGAATLARVDRAIRNHSAGTATFLDVFEATNEVDGTLTLERFLDAVERHGGNESRALAREYVTTDANPPGRWENVSYRDVYGHPTASVESSLEEPAGASIQDPVEVPRGEPVDLTLAVHNDGNRSGHHGESVSVGHDGELVATVALEGWVDPGETFRRTFTHTFEDTGRHVVLAEEFAAIEVVEPGPVEVDSELVTHRVAIDEPVAVQALVHNDGESQRTVELPLAANGSVVETANVTVRANATAEATLEFTPEAPGTYDLALDGEEVGTAEVAPVPRVEGAIPTDPDDDGRYEDLTADDEVGQDDVVVFFEHQHREEFELPAFDFSDSGSVGHGDVVALFETVVLD